MELKKEFLLSVRYVLKSEGKDNLISDNIEDLQYWKKFYERKHKKEYTIFDRILNKEIKI